MAYVMGVGLYLANSIKDAAKSMEYVDLDEELHTFLWKNKNHFLSHIKLIVQLDPYGDRIFTKEEIDTLSRACDSITQCVTIGENAVLLAKNLHRILLGKIFSPQLKNYLVKNIKNNKMAFSVSEDPFLMTRR